MRYLPPGKTPHLPQGLCIGAHVGEDDQHMLLALVGQELSSGERQARGDDPLNAGEWLRVRARR